MTIAKFNRFYVVVGLLAVAIAPNLVVYWYGKADTQALELATAKTRIEIAAAEMRVIEQDFKMLDAELAAVKEAAIANKAQLLSFEREQGRRIDRMSEAIGRLSENLKGNRGLSRGKIGAIDR